MLCSILLVLPTCQQCLPKVVVDCSDRQRDVVDDLVGGPVVDDLVGRSVDFVQHRGDSVNNPDVELSNSVGCDQMPS